MTLKLTPELVRAAYAFLTETDPFKKWNLPDADDIKCIVSNSKKDYGALQAFGPDIFLYVSQRCIGHISTLLETVAHEIVHLHQARTGLPIDHGPAFRKWAALVCRHHREFDPKNFY